MYEHLQKALTVNEEFDCDFGGAEQVENMHSFE